MSHYRWQSRKNGADYYDTRQGLRAGIIDLRSDGLYAALVITGWFDDAGARWQQIGDTHYEYPEAKRLVEATVRMEN